MLLNDDDEYDSHILPTVSALAQWNYKAPVLLQKLPECFSTDILSGDNHDDGGDEGGDGGDGGNGGDGGDYGDYGDGGLLFRRWRHAC